MWPKPCSTGRDSLFEPTDRIEFAWGVPEFRRFFYLDKAKLPALVRRLVTEALNGVLNTLAWSVEVARYLLRGYRNSIATPD